MKALKVTAAVMLIGTAALTTSGCSWAQRGAAGGGLAGAVAGASIGNATMAAPATGAIIGGTSTALVGGAAGDAYDQVTLKDKNRELENLRAEVLNKESEIAALRATGLTPEREAELSAAQTRLGELEQQLAEAQASLDAAKAEVQTTSLTRSALESEVSSKAAEMENLRAEIAAADARRQVSEEEAARLRSEADTLRAAVVAKEAELKEARGTLNVLQTSLEGKQQKLQELQTEMQNLNVQLEETSRGLTLTIAESLLYEPGKAELTKDGKKLLGEVATILKDRFPKNEFIIEGHTDNQPIVRSGWRSNWELGAARALTMVHELVDNQGISPSKVSATTFGEFRPSSSNDTTDGRRLNRRAVIVVVPEALPLQRQNLALAK
ncbi:OmpA family protein [bacterium]|nr:OmpA family protein [bacterium]